MFQHHSFIQQEVIVVISWASGGSSVALDMFQALSCFTVSSLKGMSTTGSPLRHNPNKQLNNF